MSLTTTAALVAAALAVLPAAPQRRVRAQPVTPSITPRDGPAWTDPQRCASDIALFAECFRAGLPLAAAAGAVADTHGAARSPWRTVTALSALGVEPERAWSELCTIPGGEALASLVTMSEASGTAIVEGCGRITEQLRGEAADRAKAKAERAGVLIAIPLTAFFLPAFFALGLAPVVISLGATLLS